MRYVLIGDRLISRDGTVIELDVETLELLRDDVLILRF